MYRYNCTVFIVVFQSSGVPIGRRIPLNIQIPIQPILYGVADHPLPMLRVIEPRLSEVDVQHCVIGMPSKHSRRQQGVHHLAGAAFAGGVGEVGGGLGGLVVVVLHLGQAVALGVLGVGGLEVLLAPQVVLVQLDDVSIFIQDIADPDRKSVV